MFFQMLHRQRNRPRLQFVEARPHIRHDLGQTRRERAAVGVAQAENVGARVLGTVLNDPQEILGTSEDYYYYQYRYSERKRAV